MKDQKRKNDAQIEVKKFPLKIKWDIVLIVFSCIGFAAFSLFFALKIKGGICPDEAYHHQLVEVFSKTIKIPEYGSENYKYGNFSTRPYLYYWLLGRLLHWNFFEISQFTFLRIINWIFGLITIFFSVKSTFLLLKDNKIARIICIFMITNTLMFTFLNGGINYDNLTNLFAFASAYYLICIFKKHRIKDLLILGIVVCLGILTKFTLVPLFGIYVMLLLLFELANYRVYISQIVDIFKNRRYWYLPLLLLFLLSAYFGVGFYVNNMLKYKRVDPACEQVLTHEQCLLWAIYDRDNSFYKNEGTGDRINIIDYFPTWVNMMMRKTFGIMGHSAIAPSKAELTPFYLLFLFAGISYFVNYKKLTRLDIIFTIICIVYIAVLGLYMNYKTYVKTDLLGLAVQGRYIFPILLIGYYLIAKAICSYKQIWISLGLLFYVIIIFIWGSYYFYFSNVSQMWYNNVFISSYGSGINKNDVILGGLTENVKFTQTFLSEYDNMIGIRTFIYTFNQKDLSDYDLVIYDSSCKNELRRINMNISKKLELGYREYFFDPIKNSSNKEFCLTITPNEPVEFPISLELAKEGGYEQGVLTINGDILEKDIVFGSIHKK